MWKLPCSFKNSFIEERVEGGPVYYCNAKFELNVDGMSKSGLHILVVI